MRSIKIRKNIRNIIIGIVVVCACLLLIRYILSSLNSYKKVSTGQVLKHIDDNDIKSAKLFSGNIQEISIILNNNQRLKSNYISSSGADIQNKLQSSYEQGKIKGYDVQISRPSILGALIINILPFIIMFLVFVAIIGGAQGGGNKIMNFGRSRAKLFMKNYPKVRFKDVAGAEEALEELVEVVEFLKNPAKFRKMGAKIPRGVLLYGAPGTGKTLLARAVAGEANVPFYSISGSDFVEMFVGVGASRVRDLFKQAKSNSPCIIFMDEIDAVGRHRGAGLGGGHDEREQTLNQLLVEMDGFDSTTGIILIAATNRPDILDNALLRPGRFDRQVAIDRPTMDGRHKILEVHSKSKPFKKDVDLKVIAKKTPGFTGADLSNILNESAILAARHNKTAIDNHDIDEAIDRVIAGPQKKSRLMSEEERRITAYHEGGHALVAHALPNTDPVQKLTILSRGKALGYTMILPDRDKYSVTRLEMLDQMAYALGGRAAEELIFSSPTTGASNDIEKATAMARSMVMEYGMTHSLGAVRYSKATSPTDRYYGGNQEREYSEDVATTIDKEVRELIQGAHKEAYNILKENIDILHKLVEILLEKETLHKDEIDEIFKDVIKFPNRPDWRWESVSK